MTRLYIHAQTLIDGISDAPKKDQFITVEDDKIIDISDYHKINEDVIHENVVTPGFFNCHVHILYPVANKQISLPTPIIRTWRKSFLLPITSKELYM